MLYCNTVVLYENKYLNTDNSSSVISILNIHVFSYIYIHFILKTSGKCGPISVYTAIGP